ncbi:Beta-L-arabinofuranosidase-like protein [Candidatus Nanopelagicus hibericus]|uniref:Beta-L-arabinofuranosidase-like protein n=1 Tax=Candidatus Nanopelagicus hibericus TaxID=1884915 RepID=A0A249K8U3_9ACTN|nr:beta-L-arabinofuranosidase domain-containing protein [Candidatus Nanopelagicus hibericus]ASY13145.1 Beta-L-arabinofuranosidase-like protein [Candidatus Nanopelagicus hibericus]
MTKSNRATYKPVPINAVKIGGWLEQQSSLAMKGFIGSLPLISKEVWSDVFASGQLGIKSAYGTGNNVAKVEWWNGESEGNWLIGWIGHVLLHGKTAEIEQVRTYLNRILAQQGADGYIGMFTAEARASRNFIVGDLWTQSRAILALQLWADYTDDNKVRDCVSKALDYTIDRYRKSDKNLRFNAPSGDSCGAGHDLMFMDALAEQSRQTGDLRFIEFGKELYADYSAGVMDWHETDGQLQTLLSDEPIVGHGAHAVEFLRVPLALAEHLGDEQYLKAFKNGMVKIERAIGIGGGVKSDEQISLPGIECIPLPENGYEICTMFEMIITLLESVRLTGDFHYLDLAEKLFLNDFQAAVTNDGRRTVYCMAQNQPAATHQMGTRWDISPTHDDVAVCCVPNAGKILPIFARRMLAQADDLISFQLYGAMAATVQIQGKEVSIKQVTSYPFEERITAHISAPELTFTAEFRIPAWCKKAAIKVSGAKDVKQTQLADRFQVTATWGADSKVEIDLPQELTQRTISDGRYVFDVGPLVFSVPIQHVATDYREYKLPGYADQDLVAVNAKWMFPPAFRKADLATSKVERTALPEGSYPWSDQPSISISTNCWNLNPHADEGLDVSAFHKVKLVPMGTTVLRWTAFPQAR